MIKLAHSPSAISMFNKCAKNYYHQRIAKDVKQGEPSDAVKKGFELHKHLENRLAKEVPLPGDLQHMEAICAQLMSAAGDTFAEKELTINKNFQPCGWFDKEAWIRCKADVLIVGEDSDSAIVLDWKTGKPNNDTLQLSMLALLIFAHYPHVQKVLSGYVWLKTEELCVVSYRRDEKAPQWRAVMEHIWRIERALNKDDWPANPTPLCGWCPVPRALCQYSQIV